MHRPVRLTARHAIAQYAWTLAAVALWVGVWQLASVAVGSGILLAGPLQTAGRLVALVADPSSWFTLGGSFLRIAAGFAIGFVAALVVGLVAARWRVIQRLLSPAVSALKSVPLVCIIVLLLMWVGSRRVSAIAVLLVVFPAVYFSVTEGLRSRDRRLGELLGVFGVGRVRAFLVDSWQQLLPYLLATSRNACGMAWKAGVAAEVIGSPPGTIGERIYQAKLLLETGDLFAWTILVVVASWACERVFLRVLEATGPLALRLALRLGRRPAAGGRAAGHPATDGSETAFPAAGSGPTGADDLVGHGGAIALRDATIGYAGEDSAAAGATVVARGLSLVMGPGTRWLAAAPSGSGKTTLVRTIAGLQAPLSGEADVPRRMSLVCQESRLVEALDAEDNVRLVVGCGRDAARDLLRELLPEDVLARPVRELSGGQRRRVELVRAMAYPGEAVVLDEPFASLDGDAHARAAAFVLRHLDGRTLLVASHAPGDDRLLDVTGEVRLG